MKKAKEKGGNLPSMGVFEYLCGTKWFDYGYNGERGDENRTIFGHRTSMTGQYCQYNDPSEGKDTGKDPFVTNTTTSIASTTPMGNSLRR